MCIFLVYFVFLLLHRLFFVQKVKKIEWLSWVKLSIIQKQKAHPSTSHTPMVSIFRCYTLCSCPWKHVDSYLGKRNSSLLWHTSSREICKTRKSFIKSKIKDFGRSQCSHLVHLLVAKEGSTVQYFYRDFCSNVWFQNLGIINLLMS